MAELEERLDRLEQKLDAVGQQQTWIVNHAQIIFQGLMNSPMGGMIRKSLPNMESPNV